MENETKPRMSPLDPRWAELHADECDFILVSAQDVMTHAHSEKELVDDYMRVHKSYLTIRAYRKTTTETVADFKSVGPWVAVRGLNQVVLTADTVDSVLHWFPTLSAYTEQKARLYEAIDIQPLVLARHAAIAREARAEDERKAARKKAEYRAKVVSAVRSGWETVDDIAESTFVNSTLVESIVQELINEGKLEIVDYQPPVQKLIKVKQT